jgi:hypothetical protein
MPSMLDEIVYLRIDCKAETGQNVINLNVMLYSRSWRCILQDYILGCMWYAQQTRKVVACKIIILYKWLLYWLFKSNLQNKVL